MKKLGHWLTLAALLALLVIVVFVGKEGRARTPLTTKFPAIEIENIKNLKTTAEQGVELTKLLDRVGPVEAQEEMLKSGLPFTGETHLLIHVVGDYIYNKYGLDGLPLCRDYFLSACYHGFIINTLGDYGLDGLANTLAKCDGAGPGVLVQCAHGAGHGFVAWHDYDLVKALHMCDELGDKSTNFPYNNCYDGVFMENIWGVHNGKPSEKRWVKPDEIYYPCTDKRIAEKYLGGCWSNQATLIYQYNHGNLKATAEACDKVVIEIYRDTCYNNFARQIHPLTDGKSERVLSLCSSATGTKRQNDCMIANILAAWSVGDRAMPYELCNGATGTLQKECLDKLVPLISYYYPDLEARKTYCDKIDDLTYKERCRK